MLKDFAKAKRPEDDALSQEVKQAREKLGYAYPEEHFYIDVSGTD